MKHLLLVKNAQQNEITEEYNASQAGSRAQLCVCASHFTTLTTFLTTTSIYGDTLSDIFKRAGNVCYNGRTTGKVRRHFFSSSSFLRALYSLVILSTMESRWMILVKYLWFGEGMIFCLFLLFVTLLVIMLC